MIDPLEKRLGYLLRRASAANMAELGAALVPLDLRPAEASILLVIDANPGCTQSDVGRLLGIQRANMAPLISGLVARDLISKTPIDGRTQSLALTSEGKKKADFAERAMASNDAGILARLGEDLGERLTQALRRLQRD